jgi:succinate dehydrogenase/fumarate reductase cytochrome b subunit
MVSTASLKKISAVSGLGFAVFLVMHFLSHYSLILGVDTANDNLRLFRKIYQHPVFEVALLVALMAHMASNTMIYIKRQKIDASSKKEGGKEPAGTMELKGHRYTGYFLSMSIFGHVAATRLAPLFFLDDPSQYDYTFITHANNLFGSLFGVYLALLGIAGGWHLIYGTRSAIATLRGSSVAGKPFPFALKPVAALSHLLIINAVLAASGFYYVVDTETKAELYNKVYYMFK